MHRTALAVDPRLGISMISMAMVPRSGGNPVTFSSMALLHFMTSGQLDKHIAHVSSELSDWRTFGFVWDSHQQQVIAGGAHLVPSGKRLQITMERSTIFHANTHYFSGHFQWSEWRETENRKCSSDSVIVFQQVPSGND